MVAMRKPKEPGLPPDEIAQRLLRDLQPRFVRLAKAEGWADEETGDTWFRVASHKHACEASFKPDVSYDRIFRSFQGWAEAFARKLGVKNIYADARNGDEDE